MTRQEFRSAVADILSISTLELLDTDGRETLTAWTSMAEVQILTLVNSELGIELDLEQFEYRTLGELLDVLQARGAFPADGSRPR